MKRAQLKPKESRRLRRGYLWAFRNEFELLPGLVDGETVDVFERDRFVCRGFYQSEGGIAVRTLTRHQEDIDADFFHKRIDQALRLRMRIMPGGETFRWIHGESDGLPGFVADRYGSVVSAKTSCAFYQNWADVLAKSFMNLEAVEGVRMDLRGEVRTWGVVPATQHFALGQLRFQIDFEAPQKTGAFLDQVENTFEMRRFARGARVLDGYCYVGMWSCNAAQAGAAAVFGVDTSASAIERATMNAAENGLSGTCQFECAEVGEVLARGNTYDLIALDPPAFAKSRKHLRQALGLYQALNRDAMKALEPGGILITSSCSHFVDEATFVEMLKRAARAAARDILILEKRGAAADHPTLLAMPETAYLKCIIAQVR
jgi:23S rRNA (cytosine1962-C5)-methyltransferase